jgi:PAS domain S-box-containing protein
LPNWFLEIPFLMSRFADLPVQRKLGLAMLLTSTVALVVACGVFLAVEYIGYRQNIARTLITLARVTASNSTAAIAFADEAGAIQNLEALRAEPQIIAATLFDTDGRMFARYASRPLEVLRTSGTDPAGVRFENGYVVAVQPVVEGNRRLGTLYLQATMEQIYARMQTYAWIVLGVLCSSFVLAGLISTVLRRALARPILELASTANAVSIDQDYSLRARQYGRDELGQLTSSFNAMLEKTQAAIAALRESEQRFRVMADGAPVLIWLADTTKNRVWFNQRWLEFTGRQMKDELGFAWADNVHPDDLDRCVRTYTESFDARTTFQMEYRLRRRDGEHRWLLDHGIPRFGAAGEFTGYIGSCVDVSDRKVAEQEVTRARDQALAASRAKDEFLAALSHELRTPLNPVLLLASDAATNRALPEDVRADFEMIAKNVALEARLIDDLLDLTRITRGKLTLNLMPGDVHSILRDALTTVQADLDDKRIQLHLDLGAKRHAIRGDGVRLQQVFWNVLKNAVKFTPEEGKVRIETRVQENGRIIVRVSDTGIGLTAAEIERIFDAFSQGDHTDNEKYHRFGGLGLGLAISKRLVELHTGTIRASSPGRNQGATFDIELPLEPAAVLRS